MNYVVGRLGSAIGEPTAHHWGIMKSTLLYLVNTRDYGLHFRRGRQKSHNKAQSKYKTDEIVAICDEDWANDRIGLKSIMVGFIAYQEMPVMWTSKKQDTIAMSTVDAEFLAMVNVLEIAVYLEQLGRSLQPRRAKLTLENDN